MVLKDIFEDLWHVLHLKYEKNPNGTYRANTVIRQLVYPELYSSETFSDNEICYYLQNSNLSYQGKPNIKNSFSELMKPKEVSNRYPIVRFCNDIDIHKMYEYYSTLIDDENQPEVLDLISKITFSHPEYEVKLNLITKTPAQSITWIVIFSMFNSNYAMSKYNDYIEKQMSISPTNITSVSSSDSPIRYSICERLHKNGIFLKINNSFMILAIIIMLIYLSVYYSLIILDHTSYSDNIAVILLIASLVLFLLRFMHMNYANVFYSKQFLFSYFEDDEHIKNIYEPTINKSKINPAYRIKNTTYVAQEKRRIIIRIVSGLLMFASIFVSVILNSFPILLALICLICVISIVCDRRLHEIYYRKKYDELTLEKGKRPTEKHGLAKMFKSEYAETHFEQSHKRYDSSLQYHSCSCLKYVFSKTHYRYVNYYTILTIGLSCSTIGILVFVILNKYIVDLASYLRFNTSIATYTFIMAYLFIQAVYNITTLTDFSANVSNLALIKYISSHSEDDTTFTENNYLSLLSKNVINISDVIDGMFTYNMEYLDNGKTIKKIYPETDRMNYCHKIIHTQRYFRICIFLLCVALFCLLVWHMKCYIALIPLCILFFVLYILSSKRCLWKLCKGEIIRSIKDLN